MQSFHTAYLSLSSRCGNRQANILQALQYVRARAEIDRVSSFYEAQPTEGADQPRHHLAVCRIRTELDQEALLSLLQRIETRMRRGEDNPNDSRPIAIALLIYDEALCNGDPLSIPHPTPSLAPLAEIAPDVLHPLLGRASLPADSSRQGATRLSRKLRQGRDAHKERPAVPLRLSRVGVTNQRRTIQLVHKGKPAFFSARLDLFVDLAQDQAGVHMSRFGGLVEEIVRRTSLDPMPDIASLAGRLSRGVAAVQGALRSEVHIRAGVPLQKTTPISGKSAEELYTQIGIASTEGEQTRRVIGVETEGMTVCPCAQDMVRASSRDRLLEQGFTPGQVERILTVVPLASHNQRGRGALFVGADSLVRAENLVHLVEAAMSSETYAVLKRPDELFVVDKSHRRPRFVEDVVREMLSSIVDMFPDLPDDIFVLARQENLESIHKHNAVAERYGTLGEIRRELRGEEGDASRTSLDQWLKGQTGSQHVPYRS